jgi:hypothetical protein
MKGTSSGFFWPSFADLMTALFFIMLVLYVLTYLKLKNNEMSLKIKVENLDKKLKVYNLVEQSINPLKTDSSLFKYENDYKRFTLSFDVKFKTEKVVIGPSGLDNYDQTVVKINQAGRKLINIVDQLLLEKKMNKELENVSYLIIISGYASNLSNDEEYTEYLRSYNRAWHLWKHWVDKGINFEDDKYKDIIDLQICGNGWGGIGRFERDPENGFKNEYKNQRFVIQIVPKIGDVKIQ